MESTRSLNSSAIRYGITILVLIIIASLSQFSGLILFFYIFLAFIVFFGIRFFGVIASVLDYRIISKFIKYIFSAGAFLFILEFILLSLGYLFVSALDPAYSLFPFFFLTLWILFMLLGGDRELSDHSPFVSEYFRKLSSSFLFFSLSLFAFYYSYSNFDLVVLFPALLYTAISSFIFSIFPLLSSSSDHFRKNIGEYISVQYIKWEIAAFILGFFQGLLAVPKPASENSTLLLVLLLLIVIAVLVAIWKTYRQATDNFIETQLGLYEKFKRRENITSNAGIDYLSRAIDEFNSTGRKERIVLSITSYLTRLGKTELEIEGYLKGIIGYKSRNLRNYGITNRNAIIKSEIRQRSAIIKAMVASIKKNEGEENAGQQ